MKLKAVEDFTITEKKRKKKEIQADNTYLKAQILTRLEKFF